MDLKERMKYEEVWRSQVYRDARNKRAAQRVDQLAHHFSSVGAKRILDVGIGTGKTAKLLEKRGFEMEGLDIAANALEEDIPTVICPVWEADAIGRYDGIMCIDVLEHIPNEYVTKTLEVLERLAPHGYLVIALNEEKMKFNEPLHLTVESADWWNSKIRFADVQANLSGTHAIARY